MEGRKPRRLSELDGWSSCELRTLFEDIARWKGKGYHFHAWTVGGQDPQLVLHSSTGNPVLSFEGRRAVAIAILWPDVLPDPNDQREENPNQ